MGSCPFCTQLGKYTFQYLLALRDLSFAQNAHQGVQNELQKMRHLFSMLICNFDFSSKPLQIWEKNVRNGHIKRVTDPDIQSSVIEIMGTNVSTNFITCPLDPKQTLTIKLPFLVMIIKNVSNLS